MFTFYLHTMPAIPNVTLKRWLCDKEGGRSYPFYSGGPCLSVLTLIISGNFRPFVTSFLVRISNFMGDLLILNERFLKTIYQHIYYQKISIFILIFLPHFSDDNNIWLKLLCNHQPKFIGSFDWLINIFLGSSQRPILSSLEFVSYTCVALYQ